MFTGVAFYPYLVVKVKRVFDRQSDFLVTMQKRLDNEQFLSTLAVLLKTSNEQGSVYLEQKRLTKTGADSVIDATTAPYPLLFRATDGAKTKSKRVKISTIVSPDNLDQFWQGYTEALKSGMAGLRRKDKKKQRK